MDIKNYTGIKHGKWKEKLEVENALESHEKIFLIELSSKGNWKENWKGLKKALKLDKERLVESDLE